MAKKTNHKEEKPIQIEKPNTIDWSSLPQSVVIIGEGGKHVIKGREYTVSKETAKILIDKGVAKLK